MNAILRKNKTALEDCMHHVIKGGYFPANGVEFRFFYDNYSAVLNSINIETGWLTKQ